MMTAFLIVHIMLAVTSVFYAVLIAYKTKTNIESITRSSVTKMWLSLGGVVGSGIGLAVISKASLGQSCITLLSFIGIIGVVHVYQKTAREKTGCPYLDQL